MSEGNKRNIRPACERCHLSKTACNRPEDSACARCLRLGLAASCVFHHKKPYRRSRGNHGAETSHHATTRNVVAPVAMQDVPTPSEPATEHTTTYPRAPEFLTPQFQTATSPAQPPRHISPIDMEPYFQSPSRAPSVVNIPPAESISLNYSPYFHHCNQPPMNSYNPTHGQAILPADSRTAMFDRDRDESILLWSEQSATPSTLSQMFRNRRRSQPAVEPLSATNPTQPLLQHIQEDCNSEMQYLQQQHLTSNGAEQTADINPQPVPPNSQPASQIDPTSSLQIRPSHQTMKNQPLSALHSPDTQRHDSNVSQQHQQQPLVTQSVQAPPLPQPLPRSVFIQLTELNLRYRLQLLIDRRQLSIRHLHMAAAILSEGMLEQDFIQLSALTPMPLSCSLKADFAHSESYHVWCSRAIEESVGFNKGSKPPKQFVIYFDFSDSPLLCVEDEESAAGMHSVSQLNHMARTPQPATYTMRTSRNISTAASIRKNSNSRGPERSSSDRSNRKRRRSKKSEDCSSSSHSSDSDSDGSHESRRGSSSRNEASRQELEELICRRRAAFEGPSVPSSYEKKYPMHLTSCIHYKKNMTSLAPSADTVASTPFVLDGGHQSTSTDPPAAAAEESCSCPVVVHRRMFVQVNREFERLFGWSQREIRDQLLHFGARRWEQRMWKMNVPAAYEVLLMQFIMSAQLDTNISATLFNKYHSSIPAVISKHVMVAHDGDLDGYTFQFLPISKWKNTRKSKTSVQ